MKGAGTARPVRAGARVLTDSRGLSRFVPDDRPGGVPRGMSVRRA